MDHKKKRLHIEEIINKCHFKNGGVGLEKLRVRRMREMQKKKKKRKKER